MVNDPNALRREQTDLPGGGSSTDAGYGGLTESSGRLGHDVKDQGGMGGERHAAVPDRNEKLPLRSTPRSDGSTAMDASAEETSNAAQAAVAEAMDDDAAVPLNDEGSGPTAVGPGADTERAGLWSTDLAGSSTQGGHTGAAGAGGGRDHSMT